MPRLRDAMFAIDDGALSLRRSLTGVWPPLVPADGTHLSVLELMARFAQPGVALRELAVRGGAGVWAQIGRSSVVSGVRAALRDPYALRQANDLCGPYALLFELCRRHPTAYVRAVSELFDEGTFTTRGGYRFEAPSDLRQREPTGEPAEWLVVATMRDDENLTEDVDDGWGLEAFTWPTEISRWFEQLLGLRGEIHKVYATGEMDALRAAQHAIDDGGVAVLLVDSDMITPGPGHTESDVWLRQRQGLSRSWGERVHARDDNDVIPTHYLVMLGHLEGSDEDDRQDFRMRVWSWGAEYEVSGSAEGVSEYVYGVLIGRP